jgi:hypothetical protein
MSEKALVDVLAYDLGDDGRSLWLLCSQAGTANGPNHPIGDVEVDEDEQSVRVMVREVANDGGGRMAATPTSVEVRLDAPLGDRTVWAGRRRLPRDDRHDVVGWHVRHG